MWIAETALIRKEACVYLRGKKPFYSLCLFFLFFSGVFLLFWPSEISSRFIPHIRVLVPTLLCLFLLSLHSSIVGMGATMFTSEKEQGTFDLLRMTYLSPEKLILGKLAIMFFFVLVLFSALLPMFSILLLCGIVDQKQILFTLFFLLSYTLLNGIATLWISISEENSVSAVRRSSSYSLLFLFGFGILGFLFLSLINAWFTLSGPLFYLHQWFDQRWWLMTVPLFGLISIYVPDWFFYSGSVSSLPPWMFNVLFSLLLSVFFFLGIRQKIIHEPDETEKRKKVSKELVKEKKKRARIAKSRWAIRQIQLGEDAILKKELLCYVYPHRGFLFLKRIAFLFLFFLILILYHSDEFGWNFQVLFCIELIVLPLVISNSMATSLNKEIHQENFTLLRSTLVTPQEMIWGKIKAFFYFYSFEILLFILSNYTLMRSTKGQEVSFEYVTFCNIELLCMLFVTMQLGLLAGSRTDHVNSALRLNYFFYFLFSIALFGGSLFFTNIFFWEEIRSFHASIWLSPFLMVYTFDRPLIEGELSPNRMWGLLLGHIFYLISFFVIARYFCIRNLEKKWIDS